MNTEKPSQLVALLLRAYPRVFRERHRADLLAFWRAQSAEPRYPGVVGKEAPHAAHADRCGRRGGALAVARIRGFGGDDEVFLGGSATSATGIAGGTAVQCCRGDNHGVGNCSHDGGV
jgi:hypothetical protein